MDGKGSDGVVDADLDEQPHQEVVNEEADWLTEPGGRPLVAAAWVLMASPWRVTHTPVLATGPERRPCTPLDPYATLGTRPRGDIEGALPTVSRLSSSQARPRTNYHWAVSWGGQLRGGGSVGEANAVAVYAEK